MEPNLIPIPEFVRDEMPELRLSEPEREWTLRVLHSMVPDNKAAHRRAYAMSKAIAENALTLEQGRFLLDVVNAHLEGGRINGLGGSVLLPLTDRLGAIFEGE